MKDFIKSKLEEILQSVGESNIVTLDKISPKADELTREYVFPVVRNLFKGINKIKAGKFDELSKEEKSTIKNIFPYIINRKTKEFNKDFEISHGYHRPKEFFKLYTVKTLDGKTRKVSVGFFYDPKTSDIAYYESINNGIAINVAKLSINNLNQLESTIRHELIHSADPKVNKLRLKKKIDQKEKEYGKLPYEFDSFSHEFVTTIDKNISQLQDGEDKDNLIKSLWLLIKHLKNGFSAKVLYKEFYSDAVIRLFSENGVSSKNYRALRENFYQFLNISNSWATKPTLFDRFMNRLVRYVPYKV
jgi:hypothetical protein